MSQKDYRTLLDRSKKIRLLESISELLHWDQETYMPKKGASLRAEQLEEMARLIHKEQTSPAFAKALEKLISLKTGKIIATSLTSEQKAALKEWRRDYLLHTALPEKFVTSFTKLTSEAITAWAEARKQDSFSSFAPFLEKIVEMNQEKAEFLGYANHPYDALLDSFEPDMHSHQIETLFQRVKKGVVTLLSKIAEAEPVDDKCLKGTFSAEKQMDFARFLLQEMGFESEKGNIALSAHPFSSSLHPCDSRVTVRINPKMFFDTITAALHEGGHSLYEMGMNPAHYGSPLCEPISLGIHESQSRLWETRIGQSKPFWKHYLTPLKKTFPKLKNVSLDQFYRAINRVQPSLIRVESDEVTYSLHVILRFELEKRMIEGSLKVAELPEAWNDLMKTYLGVTPKTDREGCLQDIHWSMGAFGYFPTYTLGNLYAAQIFSVFEDEHPDWESRVAKGDLLFLREWLREHIHKQGKAYRAPELIKKISGKTLSEQPYLTYLTTKYRDIYHF